MLRFILFFFLTAPLFGEIIEIQDLKPLEERLHSLNRSVLVLWDVDDTLICPKDNVLKSCHHKSAYMALCDALNDPFRNPELKNMHYLFSIVLKEAELESVNKTSLEVIKKLQNRGIPTIAFTAAGTGKYGVIENLATWRYNQLQELGYDFRSTFGNVILQFGAKSKYGPPLFSHGILFSSNCPKGEILNDFLNRINRKFSRVILIDDSRKFLESVDKVLKLKGIPFEGYLYTESTRRTTPWNNDLVQLQVDTLITKEKWLSDEEARAILEGTLCN